MIHTIRIRTWTVGIVACALAFLFSGGDALSQIDRRLDPVPYVADNAAWPGVVYRVDMPRQAEARGPRLVEYYRRPSRLSPSSAIPRIASIAFDQRGRLFFCSGLDGYIFALDAQRREKLIHSTKGQIRAIAFSDRSRELYYSVVATPQYGQPLSDGTIRVLDVGRSRVVREIPIQQRDVGHDWWGAFSVFKGQVYVGTLNTPAVVYRVSGDRVSPVYESSDERIYGMTFSSTGELYFANGDERVFRVRDFRHRTSASFGGPGIFRGKSVSDLDFSPTRVRVKR